jgi:hypothetical protein
LVDLHRSVDESEVIGEQLLVVVGMLRLIRYDRDDDRVDAGSDRPDMEVGHAIVGLLLDGLTDRPLELLGSLLVEERRAGAPEQADRPASDQYRANDTHHRVHPDKAIVLAGCQGDDGEEGGEGVGEDVQIGSS